MQINITFLKKVSVANMFSSKGDPKTLDYFFSIKKIILNFMIINSKYIPLLLLEATMHGVEQLVVIIMVLISSLTAFQKFSDFSYFFPIQWHIGYPRIQWFSKLLYIFLWEFTCSNCQCKAIGIDWIQAFNQLLDKY